MHVIAQLDDRQLGRIQDFEKTAGLKVLAFQEVPLSPESLDGQALDNLRALESDLGMTLVAVQ